MIHSWQPIAYTASNVHVSCGTVDLVVEHNATKLKRPTAKFTVPFLLFSMYESTNSVFTSIFVLIYNIFTFHFIRLSATKYVVDCHEADRNCKLRATLY